MAEDYILGKDIALIQQSILRLEERLACIESQLTGSCLSALTRGDLDDGPTTAIVGDMPPASVSGVANAATIAWSATDVHNIRRVPTPDRTADFCFFGFIVTAQAFQSQLIADTIWPVVSKLWNDDISAAPYYSGYRPTGFRGIDYCCVIGFYSKNLNWWNWIGIAYQHVQDNPNARYSRSYDMRGNIIPYATKRSWDPNVILSAPADQKYKVTTRYADADTEWGVHLAFRALRS